MSTEPTSVSVPIDQTAPAAPASIDAQWCRVLFRDNYQPAWVYDASTLQYLDVNDAAVKRYGYSRERFLSMTIKDIRPPEDVPALLDAIAWLEQGRKTSGEWRHICADGSMLWCEVADYDLTWYDGRHARLAVVSDVTERHRAEEALKQTIDDYRGLFENAHDAILIFSPEDEVVLDVNQRACEIYGYSRAEFIGMRLDAISQDPARGREHLTQTLQRGSVYHFETVQFRKDGSPMNLEINGAVVTYKGRQAILSINRDVTQRKLAEQTLRKEEQRRRLHVEQTPLGVIDWDLNFCVSAWNAGATRIFGFSADEAIGTCARDLLLPPSAMAHVDRVWEALLASRGGLRSTNENITKDGRVILCEWYNTPLVDEIGHVVGVASLVQDVTEPHRSREALEQSELKFRMLAESTGDVVGLYDLDGVALYLSPSIERLTGDKPEDRLGKNGFQYVHPDDAAAVVSGLQHPSLRGQPALQEFRVRRRDGSYVWVEANTSVMFDEHGKPLQVIACTRDITERKAAEAELRSRADELNQLVQQRTARIQELERQRAEGEKLIATGRMAARVAHEINNPLGGIASAFALIKDAVKPEHPYFSYVASVEREIDRISRITRQMYEVYRPETDPPRTFAIGPAIREAVTLLEPAARNAGVALRVEDCKEGDPCSVTLPPSAVKQVLLNIIRNAIEASPRDSEVTIRADLRGDNAKEVVVSVSDEGAGIPESIRPQLFEPFFTTKGDAPHTGLGLGLSVANSLAAAMGGRIDYDTRTDRASGTGTTFQIHLPVAR